MDPFGVFVGLWSSIGPAAGIVLGWYLSRRSQREGWAREDKHRNRAERIEAYAAFLNAMEARVDRLVGDLNLARVGASRDDDDWNADPTVPLQTISILAPSVEEPATEFWDWYLMCSLKFMAFQVSNDPNDRPDLDAEDFHRHRDAVVLAMRQDLG